MPESRHKGKKASAAAGQPHAFWSGTIAFSLVSIPVHLFVAQRSAGVALRMVDRDATPLARRYFCTRDDEALTADDIVRGYELENERFVTVDDDELTALAAEKSREIDLKRFVPLSEIDPIYYERAYFLAPEQGASKAYRLLARVMEEEGRAGIATFVMRGTEYLVAILGERSLLRLQTLRFHEDLRTPHDVGLPPARQPDAARVTATAREIQALELDHLEPAALADGYAKRLRALIERKLQSGTDVYAVPEVPPEDEPEPEAQVVDLMQVLKRSLAEGSSRRGTRRQSARRDRPTSTKESDSEGASKAQLYARAKKLGIEGRSAMTKEQLADAVRAAG